MKVVFLQDVPNVGKAGEIKDVSDGYGKNFLLPKKLAVLATPTALKDIETRLKIKARQQMAEEAQLAEMGKELEGKEFTLKTKAGEEGHLYGSITNADIADEIKRTAHLDVDKRKIELPEPIKKLGTYEVVIKLIKDIAPTIKVNVLPEES